MRVNSHLPSLDGLRFLSNVAIVILHYTSHVAPPIPYFIDSFRLFVDLFFVISGIVIGTTYHSGFEDLKSYADFIRRRLARLYPLHLATLLFRVAFSATVVYGLAQSSRPEQHNFDELVSHLFLTHAWGDGQLAFNYVPGR